MKRRFSSELRSASGRANVVHVDGEGDFASLPGVLSAEAAGPITKLALVPDLAPNAFLERAIASGATITHFEARPVSLEEIFIHVATRAQGES